MKKSNFTIKKEKGYKLKEQDYKPRSEAQEMMMACDFADIDEVTMGGAGGAGKTIALIISSMGPRKDGTLLTDNKSYTGLILRREANQLEKSGLIRAANEWYSKFYPTVDFNSSLKRFTFPSGATISFAGCESEDDAFKFKGFTRLHFIGLEELTQFTERQFELLTSRLRDADNLIPLRVRATTNPGDKFEEWVLNRYKYWLYDSCVTPLETDIKAKYSVPLFRYVDLNDPDLVTSVCEKKPSHAFNRFVFIQTFSDDIMANNKTNMAMKLSDPVLRAQLVGGQWGLKAHAGMFFKELDFRETNKKSDHCTRIRYWDKSCSVNGDYTCGILVARTWDENFIIEDCVLTKVDAPDVKNLIFNTAKRDGKSVYIGIEQEGGAAGKELSYEYEQLLRKEGYKVSLDNKGQNKATASKMARASIISPLAKEGKISILEGNHSWRPEFINQLINFPSKGIHDDAVDALSGAIMSLKNKLPAPLANQQWNQMYSDFTRASDVFFSIERTI